MANVKLHQIMKTTFSALLVCAGLVHAQESGTAPAKPVGNPPSAEALMPEIAPVFEQPGLLTPPGHSVLEPSLQFGYSSSNRVALVGYTVIPALLVGLVDVREIKRNTVTAAVTTRFGLSRRLELEVRVPYVMRWDDNVSRAVSGTSTTDSVFSARGSAVGDLEVGGRYQLNQGGADQAYYIGSLRFKSRTGKDPFQVVTDNCVQGCASNTVNTGLPLELPTGSGFYSLQGGLTVLYPTDPAVLFGSLTYLHNFKRDDVTRLLSDGQEELVGSIEPGGVLGFNFGMGVALNEKSTFSIGYDHGIVDRTKLNGTNAPGSVMVQLSTLLLGYAYRINNKTSLNVSVGAGLSRDTPDISLMVRFPMTF
jgi:hypothetical protein